MCGGPLKTKRTIIAASMTLGLLSWGIDSVLDGALLGRWGAGALLASGAATSVWLGRALVSLLFVAFGLVLGRAVERCREAQRVLDASERGYREIYEDAPVGIFQTTLDGRTLSVNAAMARMVGCASPEEAVRHFTHLAGQLYVRPERREEFLAEIERSGAVRDFEYEARGKDGRRTWLSMSAKILPASGRGEGAILGFAREITDSRLAAEERETLLAQVQQQATTLSEQAVALREQATQLQQIMSTVPEGVLLLDAAGHILMVNPAAEEALSFLSPSEMAGGRLARLGDRSLSELLTSPPRRGLWHEIRLGGRTFEAIARPVESGPDPEGWVLVIVDVTAEREVLRRTQQQERLAAVGQLAAGVAHDFNNIMAVIVLYSQMALRAPDLAPKLHDYLSTIVREADQAGTLIQQILDFGRKGILERMAIDLLPFLKEQVKLLARTLPESIRVELAYGSGPYAVSADLARLRQAIMNLALNARDAMPDGGEMTIEVSRTEIVDPKDAPFADMGVGDWITVRIVDTGTGIAPAVLPRIFEPFFTTKGAGGNGLGLAQVYGIIGQHGGHIGVESDVGVGSAFTIYLPALPVLPDGLAPEGAVSVPRGDGEVVLIVEDNEIVRQTLANTLEFQGYRTVSAKDGRQALALLEAQLALGARPSPDSHSVVSKSPPGGGTQTNGSP